MTPDELDEEDPEPTLESSMVVLRDVMASYDRSYLLDVRDPSFADGLGEALRLLGMGLHAECGTPLREGNAYRCNALLELTFRGEALRVEASASADDPDECALLAGRRVFEKAGLIGGSSPMDPDGGWSLDLP